MSLYSQLGLPEGASAEEVKRAYRLRRSKAHPDKGGKKEDFFPIQKAYEVLSDPIRKKRYDETGDEDAPKDARVGAKENLAAFFLQAVEQGDVEHQDLILWVRRQVTDGIKSWEGNIQKAHKGIARFEKAAKRVKHKKKGDNFFLAVLEHQIQKHKIAITSAKENVETGKIMLEMLDEYVYEFEDGVRKRDFKEDYELRGIGSIFGRNT